jgi:hypothetical protein
MMHHGTGQSRGRATAKYLASTYTSECHVTGYWLLTTGY